MKNIKIVYRLIIISLALLYNTLSATNITGSELKVLDREETLKAVKENYINIYKKDPGCSLDDFLKEPEENMALGTAPYYLPFSYSQLYVPLGVLEKILGPMINFFRAAYDSSWIKDCYGHETKKFETFQNCVRQYLDRIHNYQEKVELTQYKATIGITEEEEGPFISPRSSFLECIDSLIKKMEKPLVKAVDAYKRRLEILEENFNKSSKYTQDPIENIEAKDWTNSQSGLDFYSEQLSFAKERDNKLEEKYRNFLPIVDLTKALKSSNTGKLSLEEQKKMFKGILEVCEQVSNLFQDISNLLEVKENMHPRYFHEGFLTGPVGMNMYEQEKPSIEYAKLNDFDFF